MLQHLGLIFFDVWLFWFLDDGRLHMEGRDKKHEQGFQWCFCEGVLVVLFVGCCFWGGVLVVMFCVDVSLLLSYVVVVVVVVVMVVWLCLFGVISALLLLLLRVCVGGCVFWCCFCGDTNTPTEPAPNSFPGCISRFGECNYFSSWFVMPFAMIGSSHCFHRYSSFMKCWFPYEFCCSTTRILGKYHADLACTSFFRHHLPLCVDWLF